eukprot:8049093-Alexandrium_andersonii.AAC.1
MGALMEAIGPPGHPPKKPCQARARCVVGGGPGDRGCPGEEHGGPGGGSPPEKTMTLRQDPRDLW